MSSNRHTPMRMFDVMLPWFMQGCTSLGRQPPKIRVERHYGTGQIQKTYGAVVDHLHETREDGFIMGWDPHVNWKSEVRRHTRCFDCHLMQDMVDPELE